MHTGAMAVQLHVIGGFELVVAGQRVVLNVGARRLLAFLAVSRGPQPRDVIADGLWGHIPRPRSQATLRSALWRIRQAASEVIVTGHGEVALTPSVWVDLTESTAQARRVLGNVGDEGGAHRPVATDLSPQLFASDLLPGWDEGWLQLEQERHRQLRIHALEELSRQLATAGRYASAIDVAYQAIAAEPLRESARAVLIGAHLAEGNRFEAGAQFDSYRRLLAEELQLEPSPMLADLLA